MKAIGTALLGLLAGCAPASQSAPGPEDSHVLPPQAPSSPGRDREDAAPAPRPMPRSERMIITVGGASFTATLLDTRAAAAFQAMLPLTLDMTDLNANEKLHDLPRDLPGDPMSPGTIHAGDVMLYGSSTVVLFYETFPTTYRYTRIARVDDPRGLAAALGPGDVKVTFAR